MDTNLFIVLGFFLIFSLIVAVDSADPLVEVNVPVTEEAVGPLLEQVQQFLDQLSARTDELGEESVELLRQAQHFLELVNEFAEGEGLSQVAKALNDAVLLLQEEAVAVKKSNEAVQSLTTLLYIAGLIFILERVASIYMNGRRYKAEREDATRQNTVISGLAAVILNQVELGDVQRQQLENMLVTAQEADESKTETPIAKIRKTLRLPKKEK